MNNDDEIRNEFWVATDFYRKWYGAHCDDYDGPTTGHDIWAERFDKVVMDIINSGMCPGWTDRAIAWMVRGYNDDNLMSRRMLGIGIIDREIELHERNNPGSRGTAAETKRIYGLANAEIARQTGDPVIQILSPLDNRGWMRRYIKKANKHACNKCKSTNPHLMHNHVPAP